MWRLLKKLNIDLPYDPAIPLLVIYPKECDSGYSRGTCTPMFIAALFTIAKLWLLCLACTRFWFQSPVPQNKITQKGSTFDIFS
jgi:hypothetical protein